MRSAAILLSCLKNLFEGLQLVGMTTKRLSTAIYSLTLIWEASKYYEQADWFRPGLYRAQYSVSNNSSKKIPKKEKELQLHMMLPPLL